LRLAVAKTAGEPVGGAGITNSNMIWKVGREQ